MHMNGTPRLNASQRIQWTYRTDLSTNARLVATAIDTAPSQYDECWRSAEWIAKQVGLAVSTVQAKLRELVMKGLVEIVRDYKKATRRRIVLLWRKPEPQPQPSEETVNHAVDRHVPPAVAEAVATEPDPRRQRASHETPSQEAVDALVRRAGRLGNPSRRWVTEAVQRWGFANVSKAVEQAVAKGKRRFGWACAAAKAWAEEGASRLAEKTEEEVDAHIAKLDKQAAEIHRIFGKGGVREWKPEMVTETTPLAESWRLYKDMWVGRDF